ncbi:MAG: hypothetical protein Q9191_000170 [Dirinaria sp. TL-2023a]
MNEYAGSSAKRSHFQWRNNGWRMSLDVRTVDLLIEDECSNAHPAVGYDHDCTTSLSKSQSAISSFIQRAHDVATDAKRLGIKVILAAREGYVARSDMVEFRFFGCELVKLASRFVAPRQHVLAFKPEKEQSAANQLQTILDSAIGAISVQSVECGRIEDSLEKLELEITNRLSIQWLLPEPIRYKRVAIVGCLPENLSYETIKAMGLGLVVLDQPGHYLEDPNGPLAHLREAFCPIDLNPDAALPQRIVDALQGQKVDGLHTRFDIFHTKVALAANLLGLPASPPSAFAIATDKYGARMLEHDHNSALCVTDEEELQQRLRSLKVDYPIVVKPCTGRTSWGVVKVNTEAEMLAAVTKARSRVIGYEAGKPIQSKIMVEPYIDGPEIDVDMALWDGEVLFADVSDNFPCAADVSKNDKVGHGRNDFQETMFVYPSVLPQSEQELAVSCLRDSVLRMGFRTGLFHIEARIQNSSMAYTDRSGTVDLEFKASPPSTKPGIFMLEVNPRPAGYYGLQALTWTYGVDLYAMHVLRCIGDEQRFKAFAAPFVHGPQHSSALVLIMPEKGGILTSPDPTEELRRSRPDLMECIPLYNNIFARGQYVTPPDAVDMTYMATVVVNTRKGRKDLLKKAEEIRKEWHVTIE